MREWEIGAVENIHGALPYIRFAPILALVGVGVNRIGKLPSTPPRYTHQDKNEHDSLVAFKLGQNIQNFAFSVDVSKAQCEAEIEPYGMLDDRDGDQWQR